MGLRISKSFDKFNRKTVSYIVIFLQAVSSCSSDATYHVMWIILFNALDDFGVKELNTGIGMPHNHLEIDAVMRKVADEALHGALRISGLAGVLTSNGYLVSPRFRSS